MRHHRVLATCGFAITAVFFYAPPSAWAGAACTPTGFQTLTGYGRTNPTPLTAALVNPSGTVTGDVNAAGCDIGVYYSSGHDGHISGANIHGATYFGVVNDGAKVDIENSTVSDIGDQSSGDSVGYGIFFWGAAHAATGDIHKNGVWRYQKNGIVVAGQQANAEVHHNSVTGEGQTSRIAQNGIEVINGAQADIHGNVVFGDAYTGPGSGLPRGENQAAGILVYGGTCYPGVTTALVTGVQVAQNFVSNSDIGIALTNCSSPGVPVTTKTNNTANGNTLINNAVTSVGTTPPYQAGIQAIGDADTIINNDTCGPGYANNPPATYAIDAGLDTGATVQHNTVCMFGNDEHGHDHRDF